MEDLIKEIKGKKELAGIADSLVYEIIKDYEKKSGSVEKLSGKNKKFFIKEIRAKLRKYVGRFNAKHGKKIDLLKENRFEELVETHRSTKERKFIYEELKLIFDKFGARSILDLGCGINPVFIAKKGIEYFAYDINEEDLECVDYFFKKNKISGKTFNEDIRRVKSFPKVDLCLIMKTLDIIDDKGHKNANDLLLKLKCDLLIVSFPTITISGRKMKNKRRFWFENLIKSKNYEFEVLDLGKEIFYLSKLRQENSGSG